MKRLIIFALAVLVSMPALAQGPMTRYLEGRFGSPDARTFISKGSHAFGISGGYRSFSVVGDDATNAGYSLLSLVNIGNGELKVWNVSPSFSTFIADDLSLGVALHYTGYSVGTDLRLDFRDIINSTDEVFNVTVSNRSMRHHAGGVSVALRKYVPFFGSRMIAVFGEGRLQGSYGVTSSAPLDVKDFNRERLSRSLGVALKAAGGIAVKFQDNSAITISVPIFGVAYNYTSQNKTTTVSTVTTDEQGNEIPGPTQVVRSRTHMSRFNASRNIDFLGIQFGYVRYIESVKRR